MIAYAVRCEFAPGPGSFRAEVDGPGGVRGLAYAASEREAIEAAWRDFWRIMEGCSA